MRRPGMARAAAAGAAAVALACGVTSSAQAASERHDDAVGDTWNYQDQRIDEEPDAGRVDIDRLVTKHGSTTVVVRVRLVDFVALEPFAGESTAVHVRLQTPTGRFRVVTRLREDPDALDLWIGRESTEAFPCPGLSASWPQGETSSTTVELRVPRRCLGAPTWVRSGAGVVYDEGRSAQAPRTLMDDARTEGEPPHVALPQLGGKVRRG